MYMYVYMCVSLCVYAYISIDTAIGICMYGHTCMHVQIQI